MATVLIDNYDSFTWNVYQYLSDLGAKVQVFRNDQTTLQELIALNPRNIVISPGPGKPKDANISNDVINYFAGKIPILGVCLGMQCTFELFGGKVIHAGEIVHGKTSPVTHDGKRLYDNVPQNIQVTRYHSLVGDPNTLPDCLEVTSWSDRLVGHDKIIMGVRHKKFIIEGVQYHPESIVSQHGRKMFANFLSWSGGEWSSLVFQPGVVNWDRVGSGAGDDRGGDTVGCEKVGSGMCVASISKMNSTDSTIKSTSGSILDVIHRQRVLDVALSKSLPGKSFENLERSIALGLAPKQIDFRSRILKDCSDVAVMAEIKRASPSKGDIDISIHAPSQAILYSRGGASVISVLTEPKWFKGSLEDLRNIRIALENIENRPALLRKDFIIDKYQILEARLSGADSLLLIVAILGDAQLLALLDYSRTLGMEPLVEVANETEMHRALKCNATIIGVNNRDLHTFNVDMSRTSKLSSLVADKQIVLVALSGITGRADVVKYIESGAKAVLVGEALMKSSHKIAFIKGLRGIPTQETSIMREKSVIVKICGVTNVDDAKSIAGFGADLIGLIFAPSPRNVSIEQAKNIVSSISTQSKPHFTTTSSSFESRFNELTGYLSITRSPLFVGVFSNETVQVINRIVSEVGLDLVQFHGDEDPSLARLISVPVIKAFHVMDDASSSSLSGSIRKSEGSIGFALLDTGDKTKSQQGGSGKSFDWEKAKDLSIPFILAGGLNEVNVAEAIKMTGALAVDVCGGVEDALVKGKKYLGKVEQFIKRAKKIQ